MPGDPIETTAPGEPRHQRGLFDDVHALVEDSRVYVDAEIGFQKKRAGFLFGEGKRGATFAIIAIVLVLLALIGFTVGLIMALAPLLTMFGATILVTAVYLGAAYLILQKAIGHFRTMASAFKDPVA